jgi:hypothetical protein
MSVLLTLLRASAALSVVLLVGLIYIWGRNYFIFRSKHTVGLLIFAGILLLQNAISVYFFVFHPAVSHWIANDVASVHQLPMFVITSVYVLGLGGIAFITWISWD